MRTTHQTVQALTKEASIKMSMPSVNILFTSVGRRVELIRAFQRAYQALGISGNIVATDINPLAAGLHHVDRPYLVPRFTSPDYVPALIEICKQENISLIFPLTDPDIPILAEHSHAFKSVGSVPVVTDHRSVNICSDKWLTYEFFCEHSILTPQSWLPDQINVADAVYPLFVKPRMGSGSKDTFKIKNEKELLIFLEYVDRPVVQAFIAGVEITIDVFCDLNGKVLEVVLRQRIETRGGEVSKGVTVKNANITAMCVKIAHELSAVGPITIQCIVRDNQPYFTEINARFGGGAPLSFAAGADLPLWLLAQAADIAVNVPAMGSYEAGLHLTRFDDSLFVSERELDEMGSRRIRHG